MKLGKAKANYIDANTMTRQVDIYESTIVSDGQGGYTTEFELLDTVWGDLRPNNQVRNLDTGRLEFDQSNRLYIRYGAVVKDSDELEIEGTRYTIHSIKDVENQRRFLELVIYR